MTQGNVIPSNQNPAENKLTVWLVDDLKANHEIFHASLDPYFKTKSFYTPEEVMIELEKVMKEPDPNHNLPNALLCDIFFFPDEKEGEEIEEKVRGQAKAIRELGADAVNKVLNNYQTWSHEDIVGGIWLGKEINKKYNKSPPFVVFAYTTKGPYLLDGSEFDEVEEQNMRWLFKKASKLNSNEIPLYGKKLSSIINNEIKKYGVFREWQRDFDYFKQFQNGKIDSFFLLQLDLTNHTKWFTEDLEKKHPARKELAKKITDELLKEEFGFHLLFWAGDGGIFVRKVTNAESYDVVINAGYRIYELFYNWKEMHKDIGTESLGVRVCVHKTEIYADNDPGLWASKGLNDFLKHEKSITEKGFAIPREIAESTFLSLKIKKNFKGPEQIVDKKTGNTIMEIFYDPTPGQ